MRSSMFADSDFTETYTAPALTPRGTELPETMPSITLSTQRGLFVPAPVREAWSEAMVRVLEEDAELWGELAGL